MYAALGVCNETNEQPTRPQEHYTKLPSLNLIRNIILLRMNFTIVMCKLLDLPWLIMNGLPHAKDTKIPMHFVVSN